MTKQKSTETATVTEDKFNGTATLSHMMQINRNDAQRHTRNSTSKMFTEVARQKSLQNVTRLDAR